MKEPSLSGTLGEVFAIKGRGTVFIVENYVGDMPSRALVQIGNFSFEVTGVDFPRKTIVGDDGSIEFDRSMIGLIVREDVKEKLLEMRAQPVEVFKL